MEKSFIDFVFSMEPLDSPKLILIRRLSWILLGWSSISIALLLTQLIFVIRWGPP